MALTDSVFVTGYVLLFFMLGLFALRFRKRFSMIPIGRAATWLKVHIVGGVLAIVVFWIHTGNAWPLGFFEQVLALLVYLVTISGIVGHLIQRTYSRRATETGHEIIYERIPAAVAEFRGAAEAVVLECERKTGSQTIGRYYAETLEWFFEQPRFFFNNLGGFRAGRQFKRRLQTVERYLSDSEKPYLEKLVELMDARNVLDVHYAAQRIMKIWRWVHVPLSAALVVLALWHLLLVQVYAS